MICKCKRIVFGDLDGNMRVGFLRAYPDAVQKIYLGDKDRLPGDARQTDQAPAGVEGEVPEPVVEGTETP